MRIGMAEAPGVARWKITETGGRRMLCYRATCSGVLQEYFDPTGQRRKVYAKRTGEEGHYKCPICGFVSVSHERWAEEVHHPKATDPCR